MKKLSLRKLNLQSEELIGRGQLKSIIGGYDPECCSVWYQCNNGSSGYNDCTTIEEGSQLASTNCGSGGVAYIGGAGC
ncbi:MAG: hypothetical protein ABJN84_14905 [Flavobacteriaceae bacterium]